jgi:hypothetical protein
MLPGRTDETAPVFPIAGAVFLERFRLLTTISPLFFVRLTGLNIFQHPALGHQGVTPMGKKITLEEKWRQQAEAAKKEAEKLPHGKEREALMRKAGSYKPPRKSMNGCHRLRCSRRSKTASIAAFGRDSPNLFLSKRPVKRARLPLPPQI